jgi:hypothetical protein
VHDCDSRDQQDAVLRQLGAASGISLVMFKNSKQETEGEGDVQVEEEEQVELQEEDADSHQQEGTGEGEAHGGASKHEGKRRRVIDDD